MIVYGQLIQHYFYNSTILKKRPDVDTKGLLVHKNQPLCLNFNGLSQQLFIYNYPDPILQQLGPASLHLPLTRKLAGKPPGKSAFQQPGLAKHNVIPAFSAGIIPVLPHFILTNTSGSSFPGMDCVITCKEKNTMRKNVKMFYPRPA